MTATYNAHLEEASYTSDQQLTRPGGLFSDGLLNGVIGSVNTMLKTIYKGAYTNSRAQQNVASLVFVGEVVGIWFFGYTSDAFSRKWSLFASTIILLVFAALSAGAYGAHGTPSNLFSALAAYRFLLGIGIGGGECDIGQSLTRADVAQNILPAPLVLPKRLES